MNAISNQKDHLSYFLEGGGTAGQGRSPVRYATSFVPLIDGREAFQEMERSIFAAKKSVYLSFWGFNPDYPVNDKSVAGQSIPGTHRKIINWVDLIHYKLAQKVSVYFYLNDHDPVLLHDLHLRSWRTYFSIVRVVKSLPKENQAYMQMICITHPQKNVSSNFFMQLAFKAVKYSEIIDAYTQRFNYFLKGNSFRAFDLFEHSPGLWPYIKYTRSQSEFKRVPDVLLTLYPASNHQKYCIIDEQILILGGLDPLLNRDDSQSHDLQKEPWHDVNCKVEGEVVDDALNNFIYIWNLQRPAFQSFVESSNQLNRIFSLDLIQNKPLSPKPSQKKKKKPNVRIPVQLVRTLTQKDPGGFLPSRLLPDTYEAFEKAIGLAKEYIYIENQFFRSNRIAEAIIKQYQKSFYRLKVILVLPFQPEEEKNELLLHAMYLQYQALDKLKKAMGSNIAYYSLFSKQRDMEIFVHSKLMIIDDEFLHIGSANMNERSFQTDNEIGVSLYSKQKAKELRIKLWNEYLGRPRNIVKWTPDQFIYKWDSIAKPNRYIFSPLKIQGSAMPHNYKNNKGKESRRIPDALTDLSIQKKDTAFA